ncbi:MAG: hypothetical protein Q7J19_11170, partial [Lutibacter sp.]|nr:hypothetical protein [Lutibacter sp.]
MVKKLLNLKIWYFIFTLLFMGAFSVYANDVATTNYSFSLLNNKAVVAIGNNASSTFGENITLSNNLSFVNYLWADTPTAEAGFKEVFQNLEVSILKGVGEEVALVAVANCQNIIVYLDATGNVIIAEDAVNNGSTGNGNLTFDTNITSFNCSNIGSNTVILSVTDDFDSSIAFCTATVTVKDPAENASVSISATATTICAGTSVTFTATPVDGGASPTYQWYVGATPVGTNNATYTSNTLNNEDVVRAVMTSSLSSCGTTATSNILTMTVNPVLTPSVLIDATQTTFCEGTSVTFSVDDVVINGGLSPTYQWRVNGNPVGSNIDSFTSTTLSNNDIVTLDVTSSEGCATPLTVSSNPIQVTVNPNLPVSVIVGASATTICSGTNVTFTATPTNGGTTPSYQWKLNGSIFGTNSSTYANSTLANGDIVTVVLTSNATCATGNPATSGNTTMTVNPNLPVSVIVGASATTICSGTNVTFTATPTNGGTTPSYQWKLNGSNVGTNSSTYANSTLANGDIVTVVLTSNATPCVTGNPATSNGITMLVNPLVTPSVSITSTSTSICSTAGTSVTFTASPTNDGSTPTYQWKRNGNNITGATSATYTATSLPNPSTITVEITSNATCASPSTAASNAIAMTVFTGAPTVGNANNDTNKPSGPNSICPPVTGLVYNIPTNMLNGETYVWNLPAGFNITSGAGTNQITVSVSGSITTGSKNLSVTAINPCGSVDSRNLEINVNTYAGIDAGPDTSVCLGGTTTLAGVWSGNTTSSIWTAPSGTFSDPTLVNSTYTPSITSGTVTLTLTTNDPSGTCVAASDQVVITVNQPPAINTQPLATQTVCSGTNISFSVSATGTGLTYQWRKGATNLTNTGNISGANTATLTLTGALTTDAGSYNVIVNGASPCSAVTSTSSALVVNQVVAITAQPASSQTVCSGNSVNFSVTATGTGLTYQWRKGTTNLTNGGSVSGVNT